MSASGTIDRLITYFLLPCLIDPLKERIGLLRSLEKNAEYIIRESNAIRSLKDDVHGELQERLCSDQLNNPSNQVLNWFRNVEAFLGQSAIFSASFASRDPSCSCRFGCRSNYKLAKRSVVLMEQIFDLLSKGREFITGADLLVTLASDKILFRLTKDAASLSRKGAELKSLKDDLLATVRNILSQDARLERSNRLSNWFRNVEQWLESSSRFSDAIAAMTPLCSPLCFTPSSTSCGCSLLRELRGSPTELLEEASLLIEEGRGFVVDQMVIKVAQPATGEIPIYSEVVGQEGELSKNLDLIHGDEADIIGICGMGGVGKTTLLKNINNLFCANLGDFDIVVWLPIHIDMNLQRIRGELRQKLGLPDEHGVDNLLRCFNDKSFLLLMDDVWGPLEFREIGIPPFSFARKRKVVITTRSREVCHDFHIKEKNIVSVGSLTPEQSWKLFCLHVNNKDIVRDPSIELLAKDVANKCGGLPLALGVVGKAMAGATRDYEWRNAKMELEESAYAFQGMDQVLFVLKFSYDRLENEAMREILLYCSLYPQGYNIFEEDLIGLLLEEEGLFDTINISRDHARVRIQIWISRIINAGLLLRHREDSVKLHDCVRDMALWLTNGRFDEFKLYVRWSPAGSSRDFPRFLGCWEKAKRTSVIYSKVDRISDDVQMPRCSELLTLLWEMGRISRIPEDLFVCMPHLRVLNLSNSGIKVLPRSIGSLCRLKYLNLSSTRIESLPEEIGDLEQLVQLILRYTHYLEYIPCTCISRLRNLVKLDMQGSIYYWNWNGYGRKLGLEDVEKLTRGQLSDIGIRIKLAEDVIISLPQSMEIINSITYLELIQGIGLSIFDNPNFLERLSKRIQNLHILADCELAFQHEFRRLQELSLTAMVNVIITGNSAKIFPILSDLWVSYCSIEGLMWTAQIPYLKVLRISDCDKLQVICSPSESEVADSPFLCLRELAIGHCMQLSKISPSTLLFPSLQKLEIRSCPELKELPFDEQSAPKLKMIRGSNEWWDQLKWAHQSLRSRFLPCFTVII